MKIPTIFLLSVILAVGCKEGQRNKQVSERNLEIHHEIDTFRIAPEAGIDYSFLDELAILNDSLLFVYSGLIKNKIFTFNQLSAKHTHTIEIQDFIVRNRNIENIIPLNADSIFLILNPLTELAIINYQGDILKSWNYRLLNKGDQASSGVSIQANYGLQTNQLDSTNTLLYAIISREGEVDFQARNDEPKFGIYNLTSEEWIVQHTCNVGRLGKKKNSDAYFYDMHFPYQYTLNDTTYFTNAIEESVYLVNTKTGDNIGMINSFPHEKIYIPEPVYAVEGEGTQKLRSTTDYFGPFYYHTESGLFSRWYRKNGETGTTRINIFDRSLKIVKSLILFDEKIFQTIPTSKGYILTYLPTYYKTENDTVKVMHMRFTGHHNPK
jgi:hypothetical protein